MKIIYIVSKATFTVEGSQTSQTLKIISRGRCFLSYLSQSLQSDRSSHGLSVFLIGTWCLGLVVHTIHCDLDRTIERIRKQFKDSTNSCTAIFTLDNIPLASSTTG